MGCIVNPSLNFIGIEVDENRVFLAADSSINILKEIGNLIKGSLCPPGLLHADATTPINVKGTHLCICWDRAFPPIVVYRTYLSLYRSYLHPFLILQSMCYWKERNEALRELFHNVQVIGVSRHYTFLGNSSFGDTFVLAFVADPIDNETVRQSALLKELLDMKQNDDLIIPPLSPGSISVFDIRASKFSDVDSALTSYKHIFDRVGNRGRPKRGPKPIQKLNASTLGRWDP